MKLRPASPRNEILATLGRFRPALRSVALFTAVINLLMLAPSLYMLQVYDRVLGSGNHMTLLMLTLRGARPLPCCSAPWSGCAAWW
ncbi:hypothetical protein ACPA9J_30910 [Pseudomonas aeruginosa]